MLESCKWNGKESICSSERKWWQNQSELRSICSNVKWRQNRLALVTGICFGRTVQTSYPVHVFFFFKNSAHVEEFGAPKISLAGGGQGTTRSGYREQGQAHCGEPHKGPRLETCSRQPVNPRFLLLRLPWDHWGQGTGAEWVKTQCLRDFYGWITTKKKG